MPAFSPPPAALLLVALCASMALQQSDLHLAYVTQRGFCLYSCSQDPQPCSTSSLKDCIFTEIQLSALHCPQSPLTTVFCFKHLTVWFSSPANVACLLNNSEVRHLTLIHCGTGGSRGTPSSSLGGHFAVQHLERLTMVNLPEKLMVNLPERPFLYCSDVNRAKSIESNANPDSDNGFHLGINRYNRDRDTNMDLAPDTITDFVAVSSTQIQDMLLGRELGAAYHEQARLGIIHSSVLDWGTVVKSYTVQTYIDSDGTLPFPELHLPKLPETSLIYVSFVY
ncbi:uncharacterized protein si:ch73-52p7.1 [Melanotaenia boesemani]|uniref:uncharacterized protein si:ch73-52p7.1 n=1 Tax=Melanotaenia boesemani TaxID=1250792 RepID=UPI001C0576DD|nr:uncharacterized protein si:ch73-52p7.1 [Melanotaenia boesemani]